MYKQTILEDKNISINFITFDTTLLSQSVGQYINV
jgi:hypothetical protein